MQIRKPVVAGQFYPGSQQKCLEALEQCLEQRHIDKSLEGKIFAGIVPHAGWMFSGSLAGLVFSAIKQQNKNVDTFIIFGAAHSYYGPEPAVYNKGTWLSPLGDIQIDEELAKAILDKGPAVADVQSHDYEHSIEVQIPFIQYLFEEAKILPILSPPTKQAVELGTAVGETIAESDKNIVCIGSTDLTHYGPRYGFAPMGTGKGALDWASDTNDKMFIDAALDMLPEEMVHTANENCNACGAGAAGAAVAAAKQFGREKGVLLAHTDSNKIMMETMATSSDDSIGYAAIVF